MDGLGESKITAGLSGIILYYETELHIYVIYIFISYSVFHCQQQFLARIPQLKVPNKLGITNFYEAESV